MDTSTSNLVSTQPFSDEAISKFVNNVTKIDGCWIWGGGINEGNPCIYLDGNRHMTAWRFSYLAYVGTIPHKIKIYNKCGNNLCVKPEHLLLGTVENRFWEKVNKDGPIPKRNPELGPCWVWTGGANFSGYGVFVISSVRHEFSHRFSWMLKFGPIPDELLACHHCDNPPCVNPNHLFIGTHLDNMRDAQSKGRKYCKPQSAPLALIGNP